MDKKQVSSSSRNLASISNRGIFKSTGFIRDKVFRLLRYKRAPPKPVLSRCESLPSSRRVKRRKRIASQGDFKDLTDLEESLEELQDDEGEDSDEECEDSLSLIQQMSSFDVKSEHNPLPEYIIKQIDRMCIENCIDDAVWYQSSKDSQRVIVQGSGVTKALEQLKSEAMKLTPFSFVFVDSGPLHTEQYGDWSVTNERLCECKMEVATCGMLICEKNSFSLASSENSSERSSLHALTVAHVALTKSEGIEIVRHPYPVSIDEMRKRHRFQVTNQRYALTCKHGENNNGYELEHPPRFCYRHWYRDPKRRADGKWTCSAEKCLLEDFAQDCHHKYMNDIAILAMDPEGIKRLNLQESGFLLYDRILRFELASIEGMISAATEIYVGNHETPYVLRDSCHPTPSYSRAYAYHIAFRKNPGNDYSRELVEGDSGSVVYAKSGKERWALGIFIGKYAGESETGEAVYQAILLHQALKDLRQDYNTGKLVLPRQGMLTSQPAGGATAY